MFQINQQQLDEIDSFRSSCTSDCIYTKIFIFVFAGLVCEINGLKSLEKIVFS